jgi:opacity protein-like surface antigen
VRLTSGRHLLLTLGATLIAPLIAGLMLADHTAAQAPGFAFKRPSATFGVRLGYALPSAGSEVFDFTREQLTVSSSDFNAVHYGGELGIRIIEHLDVALSLGYERSDTRSEFRDWVDNDDLPIEQNTLFTRIPLTLGVKAYPWERGRQISRFAWIPKRWAPYIGAGAGMIWYQFDQIGDFVDFETLEVFSDSFESHGSSPLAYVSAGVEVSVGSRWLVTGEGRYAWASAEMDRDFVDFDNIDLAGFRMTAGFSVRF